MKIASKAVLNCPITTGFRAIGNKK